MIIKAIIPFHYKLIKEYDRLSNGDFTYSKGYEFVGLDVILDKDLKPHLFEINFNPAINMYSLLEN